VLVVEDDPDLRRVAAVALEHAGHVVRVAADGAEALRMFRAEPADLVLTDFHMPNQDGLQLIMMLRTLAPEVPLILMSGGDRSAQLGLLGTMRLLDVTATLAKPFSLQELYDTVEAALSRR
jgi:DNA-binding response OmpR family regulator